MCVCSTFPCRKNFASRNFLEWVWHNVLNVGYTNRKAYTSPRNSTLFTRLFSLVIKCDLSTRLRKAIVHTQVEGTLFSSLLVLHHLHVPPEDITLEMYSVGQEITLHGVANIIHSTMDVDLYSWQGSYYLRSKFAVGTPPC